MGTEAISKSESSELGMPAGPERKRSTRRRNVVIFIVVSLLNVGLLALLWTQLLTPAARQGGSSTGSSTTAAIGDMSSPLIGKPMADFTLKSLDGKTSIRLADFKGKPLILNFWASWCGPCNDEAPLVARIQPQLHAQGVVFVGIDGQESASAGLAFVQKYGLNTLDVQDTINGAAAISYGVTAFPETVFINRSGVIVAKWTGALTDAGLRLEMAKMK